MKRILQISNYMYPHRGGIEQVARDIAASLADGPYEQRIICFNEDARDGDTVCRRGETVTDTVDGVPVTRCGCIAKKFSQSISLTFGQELRKVIKEFSPEIIIFHYPNPLMAHSLLRMPLKGVKLVVYWHLDIVKQKLLRHLFAGQNRRLLERADLVIATSPIYVEGSPWLSGVREKCRVIPNCISEDRLRVTPEARAQAERFRREAGDRTICVAVGRNVPYKGLAHLVRASRQLDDRFAVLIAGKGTEELQAEAAGDGKVRLLGMVSDDALIGLLLAADIFCFPSVTKNEAFGIALAEGMYYGKPAVTFTIPGSGVNYVSIDGETGLEAPNGDDAAFAMAIRQLAEDSALRTRMGGNARARVEKLFTYPQFKQKILETVDGL